MSTARAALHRALVRRHGLAAADALIAELYGVRVGYAPDGLVQAGRRPVPGRPRGAGRRPPTRWSPPVALRCATDREVAGERLDFDGLAAPAGPVPLLWRHRGGLIGAVEALEVGDRELVATVRFDLSTARGAECWADHERGHTLHASLAFAAHVVDARGWVRRWSVSDVSVVPAGRSADRGAFTPAWMLPRRVGAGV